MKKTLFALLTCTLLYSCGKKEIVPTGSWVAPISGMEPFQWGFTLNADGTAKSINSATLQYKTWKRMKDRLIVEGESIGNKITVPASDTFLIREEGGKIVSLSTTGPQPAVYTLSENTDQLVREYNTDYCYAHNSALVSMFMRYKKSGNAVLGSMEIQVPGKDRNFGQIRGTIAGDSLLMATYSFFSEGRESKRQVAYKRKDKGWVEGIGEVEAVGDTLIRFKNSAALSFPEKSPLLLPETCK
jgi:hypothetical protein